METIGDRIRKLRKKNGLTQEQLAKKLGCHVNNITHWEHMRFLPNVVMLMDLSELFGVSTDYILKGGKNDKD